MRVDSRWVVVAKWLILLWIPYIGFISILVLNQKATRFLKDAGYSVGLFGARKKTKI